MDFSGDKTVERDLSILRIERDAYFQELFETNRHVAWLSHERQRLLDASSSDPLRVELDNLRKTLNDTNRYVEWLEDRMTEKEDLRFTLESQLYNSGNQIH